MRKCEGKKALAKNLAIKALASTSVLWKVGTLGQLRLHIGVLASRLAK